MKRLEISGAVRPLKSSLGVKLLLRKCDKAYKAAYPVVTVCYGVSTKAFERNRGTDGKPLISPSKLPLVFDPGQ
jgi:hypothetical protein